MKKKKNKKTFIVLAIVAVLAIIFALLLIFNDDVIGSEKKLVMSCDGDAVDNGQIALDMSVKVYEKDQVLYFNKVMEIEKLTQSEKVNNAIDIILQVNSYGNLRDYTTYETEGNISRLNLYVNISELSDEQLESLFKTTDVTLDSIKSQVESGDMVCQKY